VYCPFLSFQHDIRQSSITNRNSIYVHRLPYGKQTLAEVLMDEFVSGALFAHIMNGGDHSNCVSAQRYAQVYAALSKLTNDYNDLVDRYNKDMAKWRTSEQELLHKSTEKRHVIATLQNTITSLQQETRALKQEVNHLNLRLQEQNAAQDLSVQMFRGLVRIAPTANGFVADLLDVANGRKVESMDQLRSAMLAAYTPKGNNHPFVLVQIRPSDGGCITQRWSAMLIPNGQKGGFCPAPAQTSLADTEKKYANFLTKLAEIIHDQDLSVCCVVPGERIFPCAAGLKALND
jgi:hypothetical protein